MVHYCLDLAELFETDRVAPVVILLRPAGSVPGSLSLGSERHKYLTFDYVSCNLAAMPFEQWQHSDNLVARLNLPNIHRAPAQKVQAYAQAIRGLLSLEPDLDKQAKYIEFIDIYAQLTDNELQHYAQLYPEENQIMVGRIGQAREEGKEQGLQQGIQQGMQQGKEQGIQQGIQQGMQQGMQQGERAVLKRLLERRFGPLTTGLYQKLELASISELETWAERILDADSLEDIFRSQGSIPEPRQ